MRSGKSGGRINSNTGYQHTRAAGGMASSTGQKRGRDQLTGEQAILEGNGFLGRYLVRTPQPSAPRRRRRPSGGDGGESRLPDRTAVAILWRGAGRLARRLTPRTPATP